MQKAELGVLLLPGWSCSVLLMLGGSLCLWKTPTEKELLSPSKCPAFLHPGGEQKVGLYMLGLLILALSSDHVLAF